MDLKNYDDPKYYNEFVWAMNEAAERTEKVIRSCAVFIGEIVGICIVGSYVLSQDFFGPVLTVCSIVLLLVLTNLYNKLNLSFMEKLKRFERKRDYISRVFYLPDYAKELLMSDIKPKLYKEFKEASEQMREIAKKETRKLYVLSLCTRYGCNTFLFDGVYIIYLLFQTIVKGAIGYGTMVTLYNSCSSLKGCAKSLAEVLTQFPEHARYIQKIRHFLESPVEIKEDTDAKSIEDDFQNISLSDVSQGEISRNGTDIRELKLSEYRKQYSALFQDYQLFAASLGENIVMDTQPIDQGKAEPILQKSGFVKKFYSLTEGYETPLTKEFEENGANFSGGEAQMVGICRALYKESSIIVLDEPSSALDPLSEYNLNHTMMTLNPEKTVIFISHRLSTTRLADKIYMLEAGEIVEEGAHEELMALNGKYAEMFRLQMEKYR